MVRAGRRRAKWTYPPKMLNVRTRYDKALLKFGIDPRAIIPERREKLVAELKRNVNCNNEDSRLRREQFMELAKFITRINSERKVQRREGE
ncbi:MAG: hypothetical protein NTY48_02765 [Candidatus Diapherotrites archaeon]|nr:hypothetical protein [Candidatus Diapherotrites archaeon]